MVDLVDVGVVHDSLGFKIVVVGILVEQFVVVEQVYGFAIAKFPIFEGYQGR